MDPSTVSGAIIWGIISGIITSAILYLLATIAKKIVIPWYLDLIYQGVDLNGEWRYHQNHGQINYDYHLVIKQRAHKLTGSMTITKTGAPPGPHGDYIQGFTVTGTTWEGYITLNMQSSNRQSLSYATCLLQIQGRGTSLGGQLVYRSYDHDRVDSETIHWIPAGIQ
jgi:hypothetical protein